MNKDNLISLIWRIYKSLDTISVKGYSNTRTLSNCMDALQQLAEAIDKSFPMSEKSEHDESGDTIGKD